MATTPESSTKAYQFPTQEQHEQQRPQPETPQTQKQQQQQQRASISSLLNEKQSIEEYLPTPVTPATVYPLPTDATSSPQGATTTTTTTTTTTDNEGARKPYACHKCNQTFSRPHNLKSHLTTHSSERPFLCDICHRLFRRHHDLKRHRQLHTGERPHVCSTCNRSFARLDALNRHCRAEKGTACSGIQRKTLQQPPPPPPSAAAAVASSGPSSRPVVPQLHIANPASQPLNNESYPNPPNRNLLPSPGALPHLPISESTNLVPIQKLHLPASPGASPTPTGSSASRMLPPPQPLRSLDYWERLDQENKALRQELEYWRSKAEIFDAMQSQLHDLQVENKVLRSLIKDSTRQSQDVKETRNEEGVEENKSRGEMIEK
ncbi:hypothetical protein VTP01DRAFT_463 [Rhizomucor pusillus]|uniref:uncharacterized protein n=1 Tax=Rhizomucor pusillus TaxID=4840 RepID=UPI0037426452